MSGGLWSDLFCTNASTTELSPNNSCYSASICGQTSSVGTAVFINSGGKLDTTTWRDANPCRRCATASSTQREKVFGTGQCRSRILELILDRNLLFQGKPQDSRPGRADTRKEIVQADRTTNLVPVSAVSINNPDRNTSNS